MSSETSTKRARPAKEERPADDTIAGFQAWHLFVIGSLIASAAAAVAVRGTRPANVVFVCLTVLAAGVVGYAVYRTLWPLVHPDAVDAPEMLGGRTRGALEREKTLLLRAIKELEFDRAMGKVSEADCQEMTARLRNRAIRVIRQLDAGGAAYRELIDKELAARLGSGATLLLVAIAIGGMLTASAADAQMTGTGGVGGMPDARAMSGIPRPDASLVAGTVSVRLVRGQLGNLVTDHPVEFVVNGKSQVVKTDASGRALVPGVAPGSTVHVLTTLDGERLDSQDFQAPAEGGVLLLLVATDKKGANQMAASAVAGTVTIGGQSRIVTQFEEEVLQVYYLFDIVNVSREPVKTSPLVFALPASAERATVLEGSARSAAAKGRTITVTGPFAPGITTVEMAYSLPPGERASIRQALPVAMAQVAVMVEKVGAMVVSSPHLTTIREGSEGGKLFVAGTGPALAAGSVLSVDISGLPHHPAWPRYAALALGLLALVAGAWGAVRTGGRSAATSARQQLETRREEVFGELLRIEQRRKPGQPEDGRAEERGAELRAELERIYGELDADSSGPRGDEGLAA
jgi:hypothetical protein